MIDTGLQSYHGPVVSTDLELRMIDTGLQSYHGLVVSTDLELRMIDTGLQSYLIHTFGVNSEWLILGYRVIVV